MCRADVNQPIGINRLLCKVAGGSLHAGMATRADEHKKLERLYRTIIVTMASKKTPFTHVEQQHPLPVEDTVPRRHDPCYLQAAGLHRAPMQAVLVPKPLGILIHFHGVFASNNKHWARTTPARREEGRKTQSI